MLLWHVCGEEVRHLPLANKSVLRYREMQPMAGSRVYLPFGQPLADSRSWSACRPTFVQISPTPAYQTAMISMTALKLATDYRSHVLPSRHTPRIPTIRVHGYKPPKPFQYLTHLSKRLPGVIYRFDCMRLALPWSEGSASVSPPMSSRAFRPSNGIPFLHTGATSSSGPQKLIMRLAR